MTRPAIRARWLDFALLRVWAHGPGKNPPEPTPAPKVMPSLRRIDSTSSLASQTRLDQPPTLAAPPGVSMASGPLTRRNSTSSSPRARFPIPSGPPPAYDDVVDSIPSNASAFDALEASSSRLAARFKMDCRSPEWHAATHRIALDLRIGLISDDRRPDTMVGQQRAITAVLSAYAGLGVAEDAMRAVENAIVPMRILVRHTVLQIPARSASATGFVHDLRKALMRCMDPVARMFPDAHRAWTGRSMFTGSADRRLIDIERAVQYSGHAPFPTSLQARLLIDQAVRATGMSAGRRKAVCEDLFRRAMNRYGQPIHRDGRVSSAYDGTPGPVDHLHPTADALRTLGNASRDASDLAEVACAQLREFVDTAESMRPPDGEVLGEVVQSVLDPRDRFPRALATELGNRLAAAMAFRSPSELDRIARQAWSDATSDGTMSGMERPSGMAALDFVEQLQEMRRIGPGARPPSREVSSEPDPLRDAVDVRDVEEVDPDEVPPPYTDLER